MTTRKPPYAHADGSNCWTKGCSRRASEVSEKEAFFNQIKDKYKSVTHIDDELPPLSDFMEAAKKGRVGYSRHPEFPYITFKYSRDTQFKYDWDEVTMAARGIIFNEETGELVARPFAKFFNYNEPTAPTDKMVGKVLVTEKLDGCFTSETRLNLWDGGTITIGEIVKNRLTPTLVGMKDGKLVPTRPINWFNNGQKKEWMNIFLDSPTDYRSGAAGHPTRMQVTPNHHLLINGKYIPAMEAKVGDLMVGQTRSMDERAIHFIKSALLGDGCVMKAGKNAKFQESHSEKQEEYVLYMRDILAEIASNRTDTVSGYGSVLKWVGTREYEILNAIRDEWYVDGRKIVPADLSWVDDFTVAKWYMDNGSLAHNGYKYQQDRALFSTNGFSEEEVARLAQKLNELYGVSCTVYFSKGWNLRVNAGRDSAIDRMWAAIAPHIHPSLQYKLPEKFRDSEFTPFAPVTELRENKIVTITKIEHLPSKAKGIFAYDIGTETENYMVNGVIVHNSLGIGYPGPDGKFYIATAGSFKSQQARHATRIYNERYEGKWDRNPKFTYLWEILYPENRIVVDYGDEDDIHLIGAVNNRTGRSIPLNEIKEWKWKRAEAYDMSSLNEVVASDERLNHEGYIVHYVDTDVRVKYKHEDYLRLHRVATGVTAKTIWNKMRMGEDMVAWKKNIPEEFVGFIEERESSIQAAFDAQVASLWGKHAAFKATLPSGYDRKTFAVTLNQNPAYTKSEKGYIMNIEANNRVYTTEVQANKLWDMVKPEDETTAWNL